MSEESQAPHAPETSNHSFHSTQTVSMAENDWNIPGTSGSKVIQSQSTPTSVVEQSQKSSSSGSSDSSDSSDDEADDTELLTRMEETTEKSNQQVTQAGIGNIDEEIIIRRGSIVLGVGDQLVDSDQVHDGDAPNSNPDEVLSDQTCVPSGTEIADKGSTGVTSTDSCSVTENNLDPVHVTNIQGSSSVVCEASEMTGSDTCVEGGEDQDSTKSVTKSSDVMDCDSTVASTEVCSQCKHFIRN